MLKLIWIILGGGWELIFLGRHKKNRVPAMPPPKELTESEAAIKNLNKEIIQKRIRISEFKSKIEEFKDKTKHHTKNLKGYGTKFKKINKSGSINIEDFKNIKNLIVETGKLINNYKTEILSLENRIFEIYREIDNLEFAIGQKEKEISKWGILLKFIK